MLPTSRIGFVQAVHSTVKEATKQSKAKIVACQLMGANVP
jgi:hypothetical protein